jgi:hypothetical protein
MATTVGLSFENLLKGTKQSPGNAAITTPTSRPSNTTQPAFFSGISLGPVLSIGTATNSSSPIKQIISYALAILIVVFIILLMVHFFIRPIFQLRPGGPGIIPVPGGDDGKLFWDKGSSLQIPNAALPIQSVSMNYSINLDVFIQNPFQFSHHVRVIFSRGATRRQTPSGDTMLGTLDNYNLAVGLLPDTSDLLVSVLNKDNNMENVIIPNIPVQEPFRLSMIVLEHALEVYMNGHLVKTRTFDAVPKTVTGDIFPASGEEISIAKLRNLKIWSRILTTGEVRDATPALADAKTFGATPIPSSTSCPSQA